VIGVMRSASQVGHSQPCCPLAWCGC